MELESKGGGLQCAGRTGRLNGASPFIDSIKIGLHLQLS